jgi:hypothetical protein
MRWSSRPGATSAGSIASVRVVDAITSVRAVVPSPSSFSQSAATRRALASRAWGGGSRCSRESASASSRNSTARPSAIAMRRISWRRSPVFAPNFEVRFISFR